MRWHEDESNNFRSRQTPIIVSDEDYLIEEIYYIWSSLTQPHLITMAFRIHTLVHPCNDNVRFNEIIVESTIICSVSFFRRRGKNISETHIRFRRQSSRWALDSYHSRMMYENVWVTNGFKPVTKVLAEICCLCPCVTSSVP